MALLQPMRPALAGGFRGDAGLLRLAAVEQQANREKLRTWSAKLEIETELKKGDTILLSETNAVDFVYDEARGTRWTWGVDRRIPKAPPNGPGAAPPGGAGLTLPNEGVTYFRPGTPLGELPEGEMVQIQASAANASVRRGINRDNFDPMYFYRHGDTDVADNLGWYHDTAKANGFDDSPFDHNVSRQGSLVTLDVRDATSLNRFVVDLERGGNLVKYLGEEHSKVVDGTEEWTYEYEQVGGVWVPKLTTLNHVSADGPTRKTVVRRWLKNEVNGATAPEALSIGSLGMQHGDLVQDRRTEAVYTFGSPELPEQPQSLRRSWPWIAIFTCLTLIAAASMCVLARRRRRAT